MRLQMDCLATRRMRFRCSAMNAPLLLISRPTRDPGVPAACRGHDDSGATVGHLLATALWPKENQTTRHSARGAAAQQASACPKYARATRTRGATARPSARNQGNKGIPAMAPRRFAAKGTRHGTVKPSALRPLRLAPMGHWAQGALPSVPRPDARMTPPDVEMLQDIWHWRRSRQRKGAARLAVNKESVFDLPIAQCSTPLRAV